MKRQTGRALEFRGESLSGTGVSRRVSERLVLIKMKPTMKSKTPISCRAVSTNLPITSSVRRVNSMEKDKQIAATKFDPSRVSLKVLMPIQPVSRFFDAYRQRNSGFEKGALGILESSQTAPTAKRSSQLIDFPPSTGLSTKESDNRQKANVSSMRTAKTVHTSQPPTKHQKQDSHDHLKQSQGCQSQTRELSLHKCSLRLSEHAPQ